MSKGTTLDVRDRKAEHLALALDPRMQVPSSAFDDLVFEHCALPELDLDAIDLGCELFGKRLSSPLLISCMTGGTGEATRINRNLASAAQRRGIAFGLGSQRKALEDPEAAASFEVRSVAPTVPIIGNLGAVQLNYGYGVEACRRAIEMVGADALAIHLNPLQEAIQPEGQTRFAALLPRIAQLAQELAEPIVVKEIGSGLSGAVGRELARAGVRYVDTAGRGGTSWARIEAARADDTDLGEIFADWGLTTPQSLRQLAAVPELFVIGSGGVRHGLDVAKAIALGARVVGLAYPFLGPATESAEAVEQKIARIERELRIAMFCVGARDLEALRKTPLHPRSGRSRAEA
jgi:isopentenyl-diphosphate delta-isomerase